MLAGTLDLALRNQIHSLSADMSDGDAFPVHTRTDRTNVEGIDIDTVISRFSDRTYVAVTHLGKPGTFFEVRREATSAGLATGTTSKAIFLVRLLFGQESELLTLAARAIAEEVMKREKQDKPVIVSLGFNQSVLTPRTISEVLDIIKKCYAD